MRVGLLENSADFLAKTKLLPTMQSTGAYSRHAPYRPAHTEDCLSLPLKAWGCFTDSRPRPQTRFETPPWCFLYIKMALSVRLRYKYCTTCDFNRRKKNAKKAYSWFHPAKNIRKRQWKLRCSQP